MRNFFFLVLFLLFPGLIYLVNFSGQVDVIDAASDDPNVRGVHRFYEMLCCRVVPECDRHANCRQQRP